MDKLIRSLLLMVLAVLSGSEFQSWLQSELSALEAELNAEQQASSQQASSQSASSGATGNVGSPGIQGTDSYPSWLKPDQETNS